VETQAAFVRTDGRVELHAITAIYLNFTFVIYPWNAEHDGTLRLSDTLQHLRCFILRVFFDVRNDRFGHLVHRLQKLRLIRVFAFDFGHEGVNLCLILVCHYAIVIVMCVEKIESKLT